MFINNYSNPHDSSCNTLYISFVAMLYVTNFGKTDHLRAFCISRNINLKYLMHCASSSTVAQCSHARYLV